MILVTGGAGFIGVNIARAFAQAGTPFAICDILGHDAKWRNLQGLSPREIVAPSALPDWLKRNANEISAIVHMGAISSTTETDADLLLRTNVDLPRMLWRFCADLKTPLVYASSAATYGGGEHGFLDDGSLSYLSNLRPLNAYGWSKNQFDMWAAQTVAAHEPAPPHWYGLKFFNVYGPFEDHKGPMKSVVAQIYPRVAKGEPVNLFRSHRPDYADGGQLRDFVFVKDCVGIVSWLLSARPKNGLYNAGTGKARSFLDLARAVVAAANVPERIQYVDTPAEIRANYQYYTQADLTRLRAAGYAAPFTALEDGVADYVSSHLAARAS